MARVTSPLRYPQAKESRHIPTGFSTVQPLIGEGVSIQRSVFTSTIVGNRCQTVLSVVLGGWPQLHRYLADSYFCFSFNPRSKMLHIPHEHISDRRLSTTKNIPYIIIEPFYYPRVVSPSKDTNPFARAPNSRPCIPAYHDKNILYII